MYHRPKMSDASVVFSIFFQFSMSAGIALAALFLRGAMLWHEHAAIEQNDIHIAFAGVALLVLMSLFDVCRLEKNSRCTGAEPITTKLPAPENGVGDFIHG